jgi:DNA-binding MarR family transcriptional regulator
MTDKKIQAERMADLTFELLEHCQVKREKMAERLHLTVAEFKLLRGFRVDETLSVNDLAKRIELSSSRLTRIIDGLVEKGLVWREIGSRDRRVMEISLTPKGRKIQEELEEMYVKTHLDILDLLPQGADDSVILAMEKLRDAMKEWVKK